MNQIPKHLRKEPLIEVIWLLQFEPVRNAPLGDILPGILYGALRGEHPDLQLERLPGADIPAQVAEFDPNLRFMPKYRLAAPGSPYVFQVGDRIISLNCRQPYPGWGAFKEKMISLVNHVQKGVPNLNPLNHSLRHVNLLTLKPPPDLSFLQLELKLGGERIPACPLQLRMEIPTEDCKHIVQIVTPAQVQSPTNVHEGSILDIETFPVTSVKNWNDVIPSIDLLHERAQEIFFQKLLTEEATAEMEPEMVSEEREKQSDK